jgi:hypothetical protein
MKSQLLAVIAIVFSFNSSAEYAQTLGKIEVKNERPPSTADMTGAVKKYKALVTKAEKKGTSLDPEVVGLWSSSANTVETVLKKGILTQSGYDLALQYRTLSALNSSVDRTLNEDERLIVLECCLKIKEGKICESLAQDRQEDLNKCKKPR